MVAFLIAALCLSILGLFTLVALKRWELSTGRVALRGARPAAGRYLGVGLLWLERVAPSLLRIGVRRVWAIGRTIAHRSTAWSVLRAEALLERTLHGLRHTTSAPRQDGEASAFLVEVAKHKKKLLKRPKEERSIVEE